MNQLNKKTLHSLTPGFLIPLIMVVKPIVSATNAFCLNVIFSRRMRDVEFFELRILAFLKFASELFINVNNNNGVDLTTGQIFDFVIGSTR